MKLIKKEQRNKHQVFNLVFSSKQDWKLNMLADMLPKTFKRSERGSGYCFLSGERDYCFRVKGYKRANVLITYFVSKMPRIKVKKFKCIQ